MPKSVRSDHTVLIANIDIKSKRFSARIAPKTDWSQLGNTDCRSRYAENVQKSHDETLDFENSVPYASNALPVNKGGHHNSGAITLNLTMHEGRFRADPISTESRVGNMLMLLQIRKLCMPQLLRRQPLRS